MPRARLISPEFWTSEAVVDCPPMTRLLLLGLSTFADDFGVLPLRPRTLRMQVFPGDALDDDQMRAMIDELAARGLVRRYTVDGVEYLSIADWAVHQRVGKRARRRYPGLGGEPAGAGDGSMVSPPAPDDRKPEQSPSCASAASPADNRPATVSDDAADAASHIGSDLARDVLPAIDRVRAAADEVNQPLRLGKVDDIMARLSRSP